MCYLNTSNRIPCHTHTDTNQTKILFPKFFFNIYFFKVYMTKKYTTVCIRFINTIELSYNVVKGKKLIYMKFNWPHIFLDPIKFRDTFQFRIWRHCEKGLLCHNFLQLLIDYLYYNYYISITIIPISCRILYFKLRRPSGKMSMCKQVALCMVFMAFMINSTKSVNDDSRLYIRSLIEIWLQKPNLIPNRLSGAINIIDKSKTLHNIFA